jgi:hypothetical protein
MLYKQTDIEPVGCQLQSLPRLRADLRLLSSGIHLIKSSNSATHFTESTTFHSI